MVQKIYTLFVTDKQTACKIANSSMALEFSENTVACGHGRSSIRC